jgi:hypothetical protein
MDLHLYFTFFWNDLNGTRYRTSPLSGCVFVENGLEEGPTFFVGVDGITLTRVPFNGTSLLKEIVRCFFLIVVFPCMLTIIQLLFEQNALVFYY